MSPNPKIYNIFPDTKAAFGGSPPLWVYTLMSKPLFRLKGFQGYRDMYQLSSAAALELSRFHSGKAKGKIVSLFIWTLSTHLSLSLSLSLSLMCSSDAAELGALNLPLSHLPLQSLLEQWCLDSPPAVQGDGGSWR